MLKVRRREEEEDEVVETLFPTPTFVTVLSPTPAHPASTTESPSPTFNPTSHNDNKSTTTYASLGFALNMLDTPPSSDAEGSKHGLPPSPPLTAPKRASLSAVDRLIGTLKLHRRGRLESKSDWIVFHLTVDEHKEFEERLGRDEGLCGWLEDKVSLDWDPERGEFVVRMPTALHERFIACVGNEIEAAVAEVVTRLEGTDDDDQKRIVEELGKVYKGGSPTLELRVPKLESSSSQETQTSDDGEEKVVKRSPDATFFHPAQPDLPTLVVEVAYSQRQKDLPRLAESYIIDSSHAIQSVVGFKIPYLQPNTQAQSKSNADKTAWLSIWRPGVEQIEHGDEIGICSQDLNESFRSSDGSTGITTLDLSVADLLPHDLTLDLSYVNDMIISVPLDRAIAILDEAEKEISTPKTTARQRAPTKFRKRKRTPSEELSDGREEAFARQEAVELQKDAEVDGDYIDATRRVRRRKSSRLATAGVAEEHVAIRGADRRSTRSFVDAG